LCSFVILGRLLLLPGARERREKAGMLLGRLLHRRERRRRLAALRMGEIERERSERRETAARLRAVRELDRALDRLCAVGERTEERFGGSEAAQSDRPLLIELDRVLAVKLRLFESARRLNRTLLRPERLERKDLETD